MKLKASQVFDAYLTLNKIADEKRPISQKGAYRVARMIALLKPEFGAIAERRDALITAYDHRNDDGVPSVPPDKMTEFVAAWGEIAGEELEVNIEPIPLVYLDLGDGVAGSISVGELITLGDLVVEA